jgi:putative tricarboxylic transport membrane protein
MAVGTVAVGGVNHLALVLALKAGGVDVKRVKMVVFKTNAESMTAMVGGHIHLVSSSVSSATAQVKAGNARAIAVAAQQRLGGLFADVATFREQGIENWVASWRGMIAPKGASAAQVAFWEDVFAKMAANEDWLKQLAVRNWSPQFLRSREFGQYLEQQHKASHATMADVGLLK